MSRASPSSYLNRADRAKGKRGPSRDPPARSRPSRPPRTAGRLGRVNFLLAPPAGCGYNRREIGARPAPDPVRVSVTDAPSDRPDLGTVRLATRLPQFCRGRKELDMTRFLSPARRWRDTP